MKEKDLNDKTTIILILTKLKSCNFIFIFVSFVSVDNFFFKKFLYIAPTSSHGTLSVASLNSDYGQLLSNDDDDNNGIIQQK